MVQATRVKSPHRMWISALNKGLQNTKYLWPKYLWPKSLFTREQVFGLAMPPK